MPYVTDDELRAALGLETYINLFDDKGQYNRETEVMPDAMQAAVDLVILRADARVNAWMPPNYKGTLPFPAPIPELVREMALMYAEALAWKRNPDYLNSMKMTPAVAELLKAADQLGLQVQQATLRLYDAEVPTPANVGGVVYNSGPHVIIDSPDGTSNRGDF